MVKSAGDVERHFRDLESQLHEDGFDPDSQVMKTARRLLKALKQDGFAVGELDMESVKPSSQETESKSDDFIVRAFRTRDEFDTSVITAVFSSIVGWKTKSVDHKGSHFVVATNSNKLTDERVKQAIIDYVKELKQATVAGS